MSKLDQLKKILEVVNDGKPSSQEITAAITAVLNAVKEVKKQLEANIASYGSENRTGIQNVKSSLTSQINDLKAFVTKGDKSIIDDAYRAINKEIYNLEQSIKDIRDFNPEVFENKFTFTIEGLRKKIEEIKLPSPDEIRDALETLKDKHRLDKSAVKGIEEIEKNIQMISIRSSGGGLRGIDLSVDGTSKGQIQYLNFIAGTGVTLTRSAVGDRTDITISASGSGAFVVLTATGTINDTNVGFTFISQPTLLIINGAAYQQTGGAITWSYSGGTATLSQPIGTGGSIYGLG